MRYLNTPILIVLVIFTRIFSKNACILKQSVSWPFKVIQGRYFGTNRKHVCNLVFVINSNLGPILPRFRDIAGFLLKTATSPLFHQNFGCSSRTRSPMLGLPRSEDPKLCNNIRSNPTYKTTVPQRHGRTDGQTDDLRKQ